MALQQKLQSRSGRPGAGPGSSGALRSAGPRPRSAPPSSSRCRWPL